MHQHEESDERGIWCSTRAEEHGLGQSEEWSRLEGGARAGGGQQRAGAEKQIIRSCRVPALGGVSVFFRVLWQIPWQILFLHRRIFFFARPRPNFDCTGHVTAFTALSLCRACANRCAMSAGNFDENSNSVGHLGIRVPTHKARLCKRKKFFFHRASCLIIHNTNREKGSEVTVCVNVLSQFAIRFQKKSPRRPLIVAGHCLSIYI